MSNNRNPKYAHQYKYTDRNRQKGLVRVSVQVPAEDREKVLEFAEKCREDYDENSADQKEQ